MDCPNACAVPMKQVKLERIFYRKNGEPIVIRDLTMNVCPECGQESMPLKSARMIEDILNGKIRRIEPADFREDIIMAIHQVHSIEEFIETVKSWNLPFPQARLRIRGSAVPKKRGNTFIMKPFTEVAITAARRNDNAEGGYEIVRFSFDYIVGEHQCRVHTGNTPEIRPLPMDDPPRVYRDRLQLEGFLVEKGEWSETTAQESLNWMPA